MSTEKREMTDPAPGPGFFPPRGEWVLVAVLTVLALAIRLYRITEWSISGDEYWTLRDSLRINPDTNKPLLFWLNHWLILPFAALRELELRIIPAIVGTATIPLSYTLLRRLGLRSAGIAFAALLTFATWHIYWSQFARYYTLVFLFGFVMVVSAAGWIQERRGRWLLMSLIAALLGALAHPSTVPTAASAAAVIAILELRRMHVRRRWLLIALLALPGLLLARHYGNLLRYWAGLEQDCCHGGPLLFLSFLDWINGPTMAFALLGLGVWAWSERNATAMLVASCAIAPTIVWLLLAEVVSVSTSYLFAAAPFYYLGAAWMIARIATYSPALTQRRFVLAALLVVVASSNMVGLASHFRDGDRLPYRRTAEILDSLAAPSDAVLASGSDHLSFYASGRTVSELLPDLDSVRQHFSPGQTLWIVVPVVERAGFGINEGYFAEVEAWIETDCELVEIVGTRRLDFRRNLLRLHRCPSRPVVTVVD